MATSMVNPQMTTRILGQTGTRGMHGQVMLLSACAGTRGLGNLSRRLLDIADMPAATLSAAWDRCKTGNVAKGLRTGCAEDIVLLDDTITYSGDSIIEEYQTFSAIWKATR